SFDRLADAGPVVFPFQLSRERLASKYVPGGCRASRPDTEEHNRPTPVGPLDHVGMPGVLGGPVRSSRGKDRVCRAWFEWSVRSGSAGDGDGVAAFGSAFCYEQVPECFAPV